MMMAMIRVRDINIIPLMSISLVFQIRYNESYGLRMTHQSVLGHYHLCGHRPTTAQSQC